MATILEKPENRFPKITEEGLDDLRARIGVKIENTIEPWNYEATRDAIRHYAHGIGDDNPLWCDPAYADKTKYGSIVALPSFLLRPAGSSRAIAGACRVSTRCGPVPIGSGTSLCCATTRSAPKPI